MSIKQQLAVVIDELPESATLEEAIQRIYRALKLKQAQAAQAGVEEPGRRMVAALEALAARGTLDDIADPIEWQREPRQERPLPGRGE